MSIQSKLVQIEKLLAEIRAQVDGASPAVVKLNKKKAELAALEGKLGSKTPDKDEEKKIKLREQIAKLEAPKPKKGEAKPEADTESASEPEEKPVKAKAKPAAKAEEKPKPAAKEDPRVTRLTGPLLESFKKAMEANGLEPNADAKKAFATYANAMSSDEYASTTLENHMKAYASRPTVMTVSELHEMNGDLKEESPGVFRNTKKKLLTGPPEDDDEEFEDATFEKTKYVIGESTKRVYIPNPDGPDVFAGYWGVGKFYEADM